MIDNAGPASTNFEAATPHTGERLAGKVAIVTGAGQSSLTSPIGIGAAISRLLAKAGARLVLVDRDKAAANRTAKSVIAERRTREGHPGRCQP